MSQHPEGRWLELGMPQHAEGVGGGVGAGSGAAWRVIVELGVSPRNGQVYGLLHEIDKQVESSERTHRGSATVKGPSPSSGGSSNDLCLS